ncbi:MAG TPA: trypsin-like peptidase domain-containing protein [Gemmata sp.]
MRIPKFGAVLVALACLVGTAPAQPDRLPLSLSGATKYKPFTLVKLKAEGIDPKAGIVWRVYPRENVQRANTPRGTLEFVAPPGVYQVEALVIKTGVDGGIEVEEQSVTVEIERCCDKVPPIPDAPKPQPDTPKPTPKADPLNALGRIQFTNAGCTATVVYPRRADGKWDMLTAAHCVRHVGTGAVGTCQLREGKQFKVRVVNLEEGSDCAWLVTESADLGDLPFAMLASKNPEAGAKIWHAGYGVDVPGNREDGEVRNSQDGNGQTEFSLSVSSGDSGGGIFRTDTGELLSTVCCTTAKGQRARVWGASVESVTKRRPKAGASEAGDPADWFKPCAIPTREGAGIDVRNWKMAQNRETTELHFPLLWTEPGKLKP